VLGSFIFTVLPEVLRNIQLAGILFYGVGLIALLSILRPLPRILKVLGGTIVAGYLFKFAINFVAPGLDSGYPEAGSVLNKIVQGWLVIPENFQAVGNVVTLLAVFVLLACILLRSRPEWHYPLLGLAVYMFAFAWETRLASEPSATRILIVGVTLVVLMIVRPQGLLGKAEVKVV